MTTRIEKATPTAANPKTSSTKYTDAALQRQRILARLRESPATTIELSHDLDQSAYSLFMHWVSEVQK